MDICRYDAVLCPNRCSAKLSPLSLEDHLEYTCTKRKTKCEFCNQEFNAEYFDNVSSLIFILNSCSFLNWTLEQI